jgi:hypothetical protein
MKDEKHYYHSAVIINSTGTGKTKAAIDLCRSVRAVYVGLETAISGQPPSISPSSLAIRSSIYREMFTMLKTQPNSFPAKFKIALRIVYAFALASKGLSREALYDSQLVNFPNVVWDLFTSIDGLTPQRTRGKGTPLDDSQDAAPRRRRVAFNVGTYPLEDCEPLLIILDDSMFLADVDDPNQLNIRALRAACTEMGPCFILFLSASFHVGSLAPVYRPRYLPASRAVLYEPIVEQVADEYNDSGRTDFPPLFASAPMDMLYEPWHPFSYGRPLWRSLFEANEANPDPDFLPRLVHKASRMLLNSSVVPWPLDELNPAVLKSNQLLALFGVRFSLSADSQVAETLVHRHLAVVEGVTRRGGNFCIHSCYRPEPVLAEAATRILSQKGALVLALNAYAAAVDKSCGHAAGEGTLDVMTAVYLSAILDDRKRCALGDRYDGNCDSFSGGVDVRMFLDAMGVVSTEGLAGFRVNFTHAYRPAAAGALESTTGLAVNLTRGYVKSLYHRCAAIYPRRVSSFESVNLMIPMWNQREGMVGLILVQMRPLASPVQSDKKLHVEGPVQLVLDGDKVLCVRISLGFGCRADGGPVTTTSSTPTLTTDELRAAPIDILVDLDCKYDKLWINEIQDCIRRIVTNIVVPACGWPSEEALPNDILEGAPI